MELERSGYWLCRQEHGSALVEFSFAAGILLFMLLGFMDVCRGIYARTYIVYAAHEATRFASTHGAGWPIGCTSYADMNCKVSNADVISFVRAKASPGISINDLNVSASWPGTDAAGGVCDTSYGSNSPGCVVKVHITYPISFISPLLGSFAPQLTADAASTISQ